MTPDDLKKHGLRVKPLEWMRHPEREIWRVDTMIGTYKIFGIGHCPTWDFDSAINPQDVTSQRVVDNEAAKNAAQADYTDRIAAALEPIAPRKIVGGAAIVEVCFECDIADCHHIRTKNATSHIQAPDDHASANSAIIKQGQMDVAQAARVLIPVLVAKHDAYIRGKNRNPLDYTSKYISAANVFHAIADGGEA